MLQTSTISRIQRVCCQHKRTAKGCWLTDNADIAHLTTSWIRLCSLARLSQRRIWSKTASTIRRRQPVRFANRDSTLTTRYAWMSSLTLKTVYITKAAHWLARLANPAVTAMSSILTTLLVSLCLTPEIAFNTHIKCVGHASKARAPTFIITSTWTIIWSKITRTLRTRTTTSHLFRTRQLTRYGSTRTSVSRYQSSLTARTTQP